MSKKRVLSFVLTVFILFTSICPIQIFADETHATRGYVINEFVSAVGSNNFPNEKVDITTYTDYENINEEYIAAVEIALSNGLLKGYEDNSLRTEQDINRAEALVLLSRTLKELPQTTDFSGFSDTPSWAEDDIERLAKGGIVLGYGDGTFGAQDVITVEQVALLTQRIEKQFDTIRLQDDFYEAVNAKWFRNNTIPEGYFRWSVFDELNERSSMQISEMIESYVENKEQYQKGSSEQKIADFYLSALNLKKRDEAGLKPIKSYLDQIDRANNMNELVLVMANITKGTASHSLFPLTVRADLKNSEKNVLYLSQCDIGMSQFYFFNKEHEDIRRAYKQYLTKLFVLSGISKEDAARRVEKVFNMQKDLSSVCLNYLEYEDIDKIYNVFPINALEYLFNQIDFTDYLNALGLESVESVIVEEVKLADKINIYLQAKNLALMKDYVRAVLLNDSAVYLTTEFRQAVRDFDASFLETKGNLSDHQIAVNITRDALGWQIGKQYVESYFTEQAKQDIEALVKDIIRVYEKRIQSFDWMSDITKENAIKKLETMIIKIGFPDEWPTYSDEVPIQSIDEGGSLYDNMANLYVSSLKNNFSQLNKPTNRKEWVMYPQEINAYYYSGNNEIVFPAGILQPPFYDVNAPREKNLGGIGIIIAHEIAHAFDTNGAKYDEKGNANNWWTKEDYKNFEKLTQAFVDRYDTIEVLPDLYIDGLYTLGENIADMSAMGCILDLAKEMESPNLDMLFKNYASIWAEIMTESNKAFFIYNDNHAPSKFRVNVVLQSFQEFYDLYKITTKDGMYVPPPKRVKIW